MESFLVKMNEFACKLTCWLLQRSSSSQCISLAIDTFTKGKFCKMKLEILDKKQIMQLCKAIPSPNKLYSIFQFVEDILREVSQVASQKSQILRAEHFTEATYSEVFIREKYSSWWLEFLREEEEKALELEEEIHKIEEDCKQKLRNALEKRLKEYFLRDNGNGSECRMCKFEAMNLSDLASGKEEFKMPNYEDGLFGLQMLARQVSQSKSIFRIFQRKK